METDCREKGNNFDRETIIPDDGVLMSIKTEPEVVVEQYEKSVQKIEKEVFDMDNSDFESDDTFLEPTYLSDDTATSSYKDLGAINRTSPTSFVEKKSSNDTISGMNCILFKRFFSIIEKRENTKKLKGLGGIIAQCRICFQKVKGSLRVNSNFIRHLRLRHAREYEEYKKNKSSGYEENSSRNFDKRVLMFLAATFSPLGIVETPEFRNLFKGFPIKIKSRQIMANILEENYALWVSNTTKELKEICYYCTTADVWSSRQRSFFAYTCHYITPDKLERRHLALACRRFTGSHTYEKITETVKKIHREFGIDNEKIVLSITDNGTNFYNWCKEFGVLKTIKGEETESDNDVGEETDEFTNSYITLPNHFRSASHTLNLLATTDFLKIIKNNENIYCCHQQAFVRCSNIWKKGNRSEAAEVIQKVLSSPLKTPTVNHWNSLYDSVKCLLKHKDKLFNLCTELDVSKFSSQDIEYLERYLSLMEPVANAIEFLEEQEHMYFGYFIAAIISLKVKLQRLLESVGQEGLAGDLVKALVQRFEVFFKGGEEAEVVLLAGMSHPAVKLRFLPILQQTAPHLTIDALKQMFVGRASSYCSVIEETSSPKIKNDIGFLDFGEIDRSSKLVQTDGIRKELDMFLLDTDTNLCSLDKYPLIRQMFLKFNTPIPSSAPVERLLSLSGMADAPRRNMLSDSHFEMLVLLKANNTM